MKIFYRQRKAYLTLLETLIATFLLSVLLVFVFGFFYELSELNRLTEQTQKESFQMRYLESRLRFIFERVVNENEKSREFFFYLEPAHEDFAAPSLIVTFDNEVRLDPAFSGDVLGRVYVDNQKRLCLAMWPLHVADPYEFLQEEVLIDGVVEVKYSFYAAPERINNKNEIQSQDPIDPEKKTPKKGEWQPEWPITYNQMPSMMQIRVEVEKKSKNRKAGKEEQIQTFFNYYFVLPSSKNPVHYPVNT